MAKHSTSCACYDQPMTSSGNSTVTPGQATLTDALTSIAGGFLVVVTGAGISLASGIPTFRGNDPDAVWKKDITELGTNRYFMQDPVASWQWYTERFDMVLDKQPNAAHRALADLERWQTGRGGEFVLITQNVDPLHERAGSQRLVKVHGSADRVRCSRAGCINGAPRGSLPRTDFPMNAFRDNPSLPTLPRCPACNAPMRQHVLWFDEFYDEHESYQWSRVLDAAQRMEALLFVGTSFSVGVTALFLEAGLARHCPVLSIDPGAGEAPVAGIVQIKEAAEDLLPSLVKALQDS